MNRKQVLLITELRDSAKAFRHDPTADTRMADAIVALCDEALADGDAGDDQAEPTTDVDQAFDASDTTDAGGEIADVEQTRCPSCHHVFDLPGLPVG